MLDLADITGSEAVIREARTILNLSRDVPAAEDVLFEMLKLADSPAEFVRYSADRKPSRRAVLDSRRVPADEKHAVKRLSVFDAEL